MQFSDIIYLIQHDILFLKEATPLKHVISINDINPIVRKAGLQEKTVETMPYRIILDYEFIYCESGYFLVNYSDRTIKVSSGEIAIIPPDTLHRFLFPTYTEAYWVHFDFVQYPYQQKINTLVETEPAIDTLAPLDDYSIPRPVIEILPHFTLPLVFSVSRELEALTLFKALYKLHKDKPYGWQLMSKEKLIQIILAMLPHLTKSDSPSMNQDDLIHGIEAYVQLNIYRHLTVRELANHFNYHPDTLTRLYRAKRHQTLKAYINKTKIESSKSLLVDTQYAIETIAEIYGYTDRTYYSKAFKKIVGLSPSRYRQQYESFISFTKPKEPTT